VIGIITKPSHAPFLRHDADGGEALAEHADVAPDGIDALEELVGDVGADDGHGAPLDDVDVAQPAAHREAIVLDLLVARRDAEDERVAQCPAPPDDVGLRGGEAGLERDGLGVGERGLDDRRIGGGDPRPALDAAHLVVVEGADLDRRTAHLEGVRADDRAGDVLLHVRVHPLDHRHDGDEERHRDDDPEQREERAKLVRPELPECSEDDVDETHREGPAEERGRRSGEGTAGCL
jgi:hypothetical protein